MLYIDRREGPFPNHDQVILNPCDGIECIVWDSWVAGQTEEGNYIVHAMTDSGAGLHDRISVDGQHHAAYLTSWITRDFQKFNQVGDVLYSNPQGIDSACIWSGTVVKTMVPDSDEGFAIGHALFYTSRTIEGDAPIDRGSELDQKIFVATTPGRFLNGFEKWERIEGFMLQADPNQHELMEDYGNPCQIDGKPTQYTPSSISAYRDPFPFSVPTTDGEKEVYMAVATKKKFSPDEQPNLIDNNGSITFYRVNKGELANPNAYQYLHQYTPGEEIGQAGYLEMECPRVYSDPQGRLLLTFSTSGRPTKATNCKTDPGQLHGVKFEISPDGFNPTGEIETLLGPKCHIYAAYITPSIKEANPYFIGFRNYLQMKDRFEMCGGFGSMGPVPENLINYRANLDLSACSRVGYQEPEQKNREPITRKKIIMQQYQAGRNQNDMLRMYASIVLKSGSELSLTNDQRTRIKDGIPIKTVLNENQKASLAKFESEMGNHI